MTDPDRPRQRRGVAANDALWLTIGRILGERASAGRFDPEISIAELARECRLSRPSIYKRGDVVALLKQLAILANSDDQPEVDDDRKYKVQQSRHDAELARIASEKMVLLARIHELEEKLARTLARATLPKRGL